MSASVLHAPAVAAVSGREQRDLLVEKRDRIAELDLDG